VKEEKEKEEEKKKKKKIVSQNPLPSIFFTRSIV